MITVSQLVGMESCAEELRDLKIWEMDVEDVMPAHLQGFFYRSKLRTNREVAKNCANFIAESISAAFKEKVVRNDRLMNFSISEPPYLSGELRKSLEQMSQAERRCTYFSLLMGWTPEQTIELTWGQVTRLKASGAMFHHDAAMDVLDALPRHFKDDRVFWEYNSQLQPASLVGMRGKIETTFECKYEELLEKFQTMVLIDPALHSEELKTLWENSNG
ncbi:hypothetical protein [Vibrio fluvialis]|uniref:hypothetical protein n=1 Tax=Vibrio fluvialis TaxID=676 RepID=UPI0037DA8430